MAWYGYKGPCGASLAKLLNDAGYTDILICSGGNNATIWTERHGTFEERGERVKEAALFLLEHGFRCTFAYMCPLMPEKDASTTEFLGHPMFNVTIAEESCATDRI